MRGARLLGLTVALIVGCGKHESSSTTDTNKPGDAAVAPSAVTDKSAPTDLLVKLSQYGGSQYCSVACGTDDTLHAIFTDRSEATNPAFVFYSSSKDGVTWTPQKNIGDDESGISPALCKIMVDGKGRVYAIWKYLASNHLDGPGGAAGGILAYRCLEGGNWSKIVHFNDNHAPAVSWFTALGPDGLVNVVWSQGNTDVDWAPMSGVNDEYANVLQQCVLDGPTPGTSRKLVTPKPIPTREQIDAAHTAGKDIPYEDQSARREGMWNLRGYIDSTGLPHLVCEVPPMRDRYGNSGDHPLMLFDGHAFHKLSEGKTSLNFDDPPTLLLDSHGREHLLRQPENSEKEVVRDYPIENNQLGEAVDVIFPDKAPGKMVDWQATQLPGGKMVVTGALSQKGGWAPDDTEMYIATSSGDGKWTPAACITSNAARQSFVGKGAVAMSKSYRPDFADATALGNGSVGVLMVNAETAIIGVNNATMTAGGQVVTGLSTGSTSSPYVFFKKF